MSRLVDIQLLNGQIIGVSEHKKDVLLDYLRAFPKMRTIDKVILFGSAKEERCTPDSDIDLCFVFDGEHRREFRREENVLSDVYVPDTCDDWLSISVSDFVNLDERPMSFFKEVRDKGVIIYDRSWTT